MSMHPVASLVQHESFCVSSVISLNVLWVVIVQGRMFVGEPTIFYKIVIHQIPISRSMKLSLVVCTAMNTDRY